MRRYVVDVLGLAAAAIGIFAVLMLVLGPAVTDAVGGIVRTPSDESTNSCALVPAAACNPFLDSANVMVYTRAAQAVTGFVLSESQPLA